MSDYLADETVAIIEQLRRVETERNRYKRSYETANQLLEHREQECERLAQERNATLRERDNAQEAARTILDMFHRDDCKGLDELIAKNPWLKKGNR